MKIDGTVIRNGIKLLEEEAKYMAKASTLAMNF
jgi:hypothetical protein